jgi:hypothetical protein
MIRKYIPDSRAETSIVLFSEGGDKTSLPYWSQIINPSMFSEDDI